MTLPILVDVDGVCADFLSSLLAVADVGRTPASVTQWDIIKEISEADHAAGMRIHDALGDHRFWRRLECVDGAYAGIEKLRTIAPIVFVTSPYYSCREWEHARRGWLSSNFDLHPAKDVIITASKHLVAGRAIIDDKPEHATASLVPGRKPVLFDAPYNQETTGVTRMRGWADLDRVIAEGLI